MCCRYTDSVIGQLLKFVAGAVLILLTPWNYNVLVIPYKMLHIEVLRYNYICRSWGALRHPIVVLILEVT